jgi:hypothetical protein
MSFEILDVSISRQQKPAGKVRSRRQKPLFCQEIEHQREARARERAEKRKLPETPAMRRNAALALATPAWRDRDKISEIYAMASKMSAQTGMKYEVDHIYPIQSEFGCGLHVHQNLQIIEKTLNRSKKNSFPLFDSPAILGITKISACKV